MQSPARDDDAADLRARAERIAKERAARMPEDLETQFPRGAQRLLHKLLVHQVELEMQNEELSRIREELESSRARYVELYDLAPVGYCTISEKGLVLEANLTAATLLGTARGTLVKQALTRFIQPEDQDIYYQHRNQLFKTGSPQVCEIRMLRTAAAPFWMRLEMNLTQDAGGGSVCRVVLSDVSEHKQAEQEKAEQEDQNRQFQKAESLRRMAGAIAHRYNNLLAVVIGNLELTMETLPGNDGPAGNLKEAIDAARGASEIGGLLLTYLGQTNAKQELMDICEIYRRNVPLLRAALPESITLEIDFPAPGPVINGNATHLQQILTNLITNARESVTEGGGAIHLGVKTVSALDIPPARRFPIDWQPQDNVYACLEVADTGCGILTKDIERVFDPFFTNKHTGRGLGLPVVLGIVRAHSGVITVETEPARGSIFRVFLPVAAAAVIRPPKETTAPSETGKDSTVLVVEDEAMVRRMVMSMLTRMGMMVLEARNGAEALEVFRQHQNEIRCVLCDLNMPCMNGWETLAALRNIAPGIPVILASGFDENQVLEGDHPEQPHAFLHKPFAMKELETTIRKILAKSGTI